MKVAVVSEVSSCAKNKDVYAALKKIDGLDVINFGMEDPEEKPELTYIHTGYMTGILLNLGAVDFVVGGCGTGEGYTNMALQFPNVFCGLVTDPVDAWLFSQINGGNCVSLPLNKGYGWAGDINLQYVFEKLFKDPPAQGYPPYRVESQKQTRTQLAEISVISHRTLKEILEDTDPDIIEAIKQNKKFMDFISDAVAADPSKGDMLPEGFLNV